MFPNIFFSMFIFVGHFCVLRNRMLCPEDRFRFIPVPVHAGSGSNRFPVNRTRFPVPGLIPKFPVTGPGKTRLDQTSIPVYQYTQEGSGSVRFGSVSVGSGSVQ